MKTMWVLLIIILCFNFILALDKTHSSCVSTANFSNYTLKDDGCSSGGHIRFPLLITSLGGSGTHHVTCLLRNLGFKLDHERLAEDGAVVSVNLSLCLLVHEVEMRSLSCFLLKY